MEVEINIKINAEDVFIEKVEVDCIYKTKIEAEISKSDLYESIYKDTGRYYISVIVVDGCRIRIKWKDDKCGVVKPTLFYDILEEYVRNMSPKELSDIIKKGVEYVEKYGGLLTTISRMKGRCTLKRDVYYDSDTLEKIKEYSFKTKESFSKIVNAITYLALKNNKIID